MSWGLVAGAAISVVGGYLASESAADSQSDAAKQELEAQKELQANKRKYELEDRKYRQDAVGAWGKYLDPALVGSSSSSPALAKAGDTGDHSAIDDPNNPAYARNPVAAPQNALPINHPAPFAGLRPVNGMAPKSLWFARQYPDYDPNNPTAA